MGKNNLNTEKIIEYWESSSDMDFNTMMNLYKSRDYHWALFIGHLVLEKLLKALYVKRKNEHPVFIHDLLRLTKKIGIEINDKQADMLDTITTFNINARYDNYKQDFYKLCTKEFTDTWINNITELRQWIKEQF
ncbi:MAG TPA: HEPN domain-containing protein [Candidatus Moranbacteria bacterium]|nr:HEPN domain protein [bacterium BMS3Bbin03]HDZ85925.1 HEPN domain-containing protein [Candidatus Moranbacteria bacterium]